MSGRVDIHICGCETRFNTETWSSEAIRRCPDHVRQEREACAQDNTDSSVSS